MRFSVEAIMPGQQSRSKVRKQIAALPFRQDGRGAVEFMLVTSRETRRWVLPKGWTMRGKKPHRAAEREAYEEAGLVGQIRKDQIGTYRYDKRLRTGSSVLCEVAVYPLLVTDQRADWPEKGEREVRWFTREQATRAVEEDGLRVLLRAFGEVTSTGLAAEQQRLRLRSLWLDSND